MYVLNVYNNNLNLTQTSVHWAVHGKPISLNTAIRYGLAGMNVANDQKKKKSIMNKNGRLSSGDQKLLSVSKKPIWFWLARISISAVKNIIIQYRNINYKVISLNILLFGIYVESRYARLYYIIIAIPSDVSGKSYPQDILTPYGGINNVHFPRIFTGGLQTPRNAYVITNVLLTRWVPRCLWYAWRVGSRENGLKISVRNSIFTKLYCFDKI